MALALLLTPGIASAQTLYVPASANVEGANQTRWRTDLQLKALGDEPATCTLELLKSRRDNSDPVAIEVTIGVGESLRLANVIESEFAFTGTAALRITPTEGAVAVTSRTFNDDPAGTYGQTVPAVAEGDGVGHGSQANLILLSRSPDPSTGFRSNIGVVNLEGTTIEIEIDLHRADGTAVDTIVLTLKPSEFRQINDVFEAAGATDIDDGYAVVRTASEGGRFIAYASVVDNASGDAVFILGAEEIVPPPSAGRLVVFESFMRPG
jgi:hypothetical protein